MLVVKGRRMVRLQTTAFIRKARVSVDEMKNGTFFGALLMLSPTHTLNLSLNPFALNEAILYYFRKAFLSLSDHKIHWTGIKNIDSQATPQCSELKSPMIGLGNVYFYKRSAGNSHDWVSLRNTILIHEVISKGCLFCYLIKNLFRSI